MRNKTLTRIIIATLLCAFLTFTVGKVTRVSALAVGPLADPIYDTELFAFKDYVEQNLDTGQLDIAFLLWGALAVAQLGAQDAMLISPYPNEENVKEWIINCGIQLYNAVIGLVPEGDYYLGIPSIGSAGQKGVPRQVIKALVAQMMGDAVVAINYRDLDEFLEENPEHLFINITPDLQLGVNAVFGLNGGTDNWQIGIGDWSTGAFNYMADNSTGTLKQEYNAAVNSLSYPRALANTVNPNNTTGPKGIVFGFNNNSIKFDLFINTQNHTVSFHNPLNYACETVYVYNYQVRHNNETLKFTSQSYNPNSYDSYIDVAKHFLNYIPDSTSNMGLVYTNTSIYAYFNPIDFLDKVYAGPSWESRELVENLTNLNYNIDNIEYYNQVTNDYLLDIRGLIGDLVNYVYVRQPVFDNIYDPEGNNVIPILIKISTQLQDLTTLVAPPIPVNMNDIALYTENNYLEKLKEHAKNYGDTIGEYFVFWHNSDHELVYVMFGSYIVILLGLFVGTWRHS